MRPDPFDDLPARKIEQLAEVQDALAACQPPSQRSFTVAREHLDRDGLHWRELRAEVAAAAPTGSYTLYYFELGDHEAAELVQSLFREAHAPKLGLPRDNGLVSPILYVGSTLKMGTRLREHLGFCSNATYALKLSKWYPAADIPLTLCCATYSASTPVLARPALEEALSDRLQPMLGKKGGR